MTDEPRVESLYRVFEPYTASWITEGYRPLILDGHGSYDTVGFDRFCTEKKIILLYMPTHSSHFRQPLDVSCFVSLKSPTPPSTSNSNQSTQSFGIEKTPVNLHQLEHHKKIMSFKQHVDAVSPSVMDRAIEKVIKGAEITIQNALLLQQQNHQLLTENDYRKKRKQRTKHFI